MNYQLFTWSKFTYYFFRRPYYRIMLFLRFMKTPYYGPWEMVDPLLDYPFEIFCEWYETCDIKNQYRRNIDECVCEDEKELCIFLNTCFDEIDDLYRWYMVEKKQREEECEYLLDVWLEHHVSGWKPCNDYMEYFSQRNKYAEYIFRLHIEEENKFEQEKEDRLIQLMKLRNRIRS